MRCDHVADGREELVDGPAFILRHAWEQYKTCSQFLAQALRHVMGRAHTAQGLLGSDCLLPLKSLFIDGVLQFRQTGRLAQTGWVALPPCAWARLYAVGPRVASRFVGSHGGRAQPRLRRAIVVFVAGHTFGLWPPSSLTRPSASGQGSPRARWAPKTRLPWTCLGR